MAHDDLEASDVFELEQLVKLQPHNADAWVALAEYRWEQRRYADALSALNRAITVSRDPQQVLGCYLTKGDLLLDAFPEAALAHYRKAADLDPGRVDAHVRLGLLALRDHRIDLARLEAAQASSRADVPHRRVIAAVLAELVANRRFDLPTFTRKLVRRLDAAGLPRTEDLSRYLVVLHESSEVRLNDAIDAVWNLLLRMVPLFWGGSGGDRNLVLPAVARTLVLERSAKVPVLDSETGASDLD